MPEASTAAIALDPTTLADELEPLVIALKGAIDAVELERRAAATSLHEKQESMADHDLLIVACGRILSGFYMLARRPDLADRIRLALRPRRAPNGETSAGDTPADEAPNSDPPSTSPDTTDGGEPVAAP